MHPGRTIGDAIRKYESENNTGPSIQSTCKRLDREFGGIEMRELSPDNVNAWKSKRLKEAAPATVLREIVVLKRIFNLATNHWGWIDRNKIIIVENPKVRNDRTRWLSQEEEDRLTSSCPSWLALVVEFALQTGMRLSEITGLRWSDIKDGYILVEKNKEGRTKTIPITTKVSAVINSSPRGASFVFQDEYGRAISSRRLEYFFRIATKRANLDGVCFHSLRHTAATRMVQRGVDLYAVQRILGHSSPAMTQRYAHHNIDSLRRAMEVL
jgi:integrase